MKPAILLLFLFVACFPAYSQIRYSKKLQSEEHQILRDSTYYQNFFENKIQQKDAPEDPEVVGDIKDEKATKMPVLSLKKVPYMPIRKPDSGFQDKMPIKRY